MSNSEVLVFTPFGANPCFEGSRFNGFVVRMYSGSEGVTVSVAVCHTSRDSTSPEKLARRGEK